MRSFILCTPLCILLERSKRSTYEVLVGKPEGKRQLGRCRWEATIKIVIKEIAWMSVNWIHLTQDRD
jgi:hypothetical protein